MRRAVTIAVLFLCLAAGGIAVFRWKEQRDARIQKDEYTQMRQGQTLGQITAQETDLFQAIPVDFQSLQKENPDIYAWITIPGTEIDDPVLQSGEADDTYLTHDASGAENDAGAIYSEQENQKDFSDMLTVLYGRSSVAGGRFADLFQYEDQTFLEEHPLITVYTPDKVIWYQIFAAYRYDDRHLLKSFDCSDQAVYNAYIKGILEQRNLYACIDSQASPQWPQKILTLSTGHPSGDDYRYLVQAAEVRKQMF